MFYNLRIEIPAVGSSHRQADCTHEVAYIFRLTWIKTKLMSSKSRIYNTKYVDTKWSL